MVKYGLMLVAMEAYRKVPPISPISISQICPLRCLSQIVALLLCFCAPCVHANADALADKSVDVNVAIREHEVIVDVDGYVRVTPQEAWSVMTDYDGAPRFISKLEKSVTLVRTGDTLVVSQKGKMGIGLFSVPIETVTEIHLTPFEKMQAHLVSGNMKKSEAITRLIPDGAGTRIVYHLESIPDVWIPPVIGRALVEFETRARFNELFDEMLRRKGLAESRQ